MQILGVTKNNKNTTIKMLSRVNDVKRNKNDANELKITKFKQGNVRFRYFSIRFQTEWKKNNEKNSF